MEEPTRLERRFLDYAINNLRVKPSEYGVDASGIRKKTAALV